MRLGRAANSGATDLMTTSVTGASLDLARDAEHALATAMADLRDGEVGWLAEFERVEILLRQLQEAVTAGDRDDAVQVRAALRRIQAMIARGGRLLEQAALFQVGLALAISEPEPAGAYTASGSQARTSRPFSRWHTEG